jgi:hypothetical protein
MKQELGQSDGKKTYEPPRLTTVSLRPEEAVLGHCKTSGSAGAAFSNCTTFFCRSIGS